MRYLDDLPAGISLQVFANDELIYESSEKWLHPLFNLENFLQNNKKNYNSLESHDSAIGKAAAVLSIRCGIKKINAELISENALVYIDKYNETLSDDEKIKITYKNKVPKLLCATENQLENLFDSDEMYFLLRQRAKKVQGVDVKVENLCYQYGNIKNLNLDLKSGGHLMILGENGAGKTTLLRLLAGIYKPLSGKIEIGGKTPADLEKYTIGYIPQVTDNTQFSLSVEEVIGLGIPSSVKNKNEIIKKCLERTSSLNLAGRSFNSLSGGEKQKISLSRCLAQNAKLLLLDEPTAALDAENKKMVTDILRSLTVSEIPTIIVVTHDKELCQMRGWEKLVLSDSIE